jgi:hypothetical protein
VASLGLALSLGCGGAAWAGDPASAESDAQLKSEVNELKQEVQELKTIGTMQKQTAVAAPAAAAGQAPARRKRPLASMSA